MPRKFRSSSPASLAALAVVVAILGYRAWKEQSNGPDQPESSAPAAAGLAAGPCQIRRVVDGDTLLLENRARIRLIGVNAPESVKPDHPVEAWGPEASEFTRQFVARGQVRLEFDRERVDRFGRYLAYVYVDDQLLNEALIAAGLARMEPHFSYAPSMKRRFREAQQQAQRARRGIWSDATSGSDSR
jgi:micrococcal nuclease